MTQNKSKVCAALGTFDGLHLGHLEVLKAALRYEHPICISFTFPPGKRNEMIMQPQKKESLLRKMGFKEVVLLDFDEVKNQSPVDFLQNMTERYRIDAYSCGFNYRFGKNAAGTPELLAEFCQKNGQDLHLLDPVSVDGNPINSTAVRAFLSKGDLPSAARLCDRDFEITSPVVHGDERGRTIGFPTVNQPMPEGLVKIPFGVYETEVTVAGRVFPAMTNFGIRPTYQLDTPWCETHIIGYSGNLYNRDLTLKFKRFLRSEKKFSSLEELKVALQNDLEQIKLGNPKKGE